MRKGFSKNKTFFQEIDLEDELCHAFESCFVAYVNVSERYASGLLDDLWDHSADEGTAASCVRLYGAQEGSSVAASSAGVVDTSGKEDLVQRYTLLLLVLREGIVIELPMRREVHGDVIAGPDLSVAGVDDGVETVIKNWRLGKCQGGECSWELVTYPLTLATKPCIMSWWELREASKFVTATPTSWSLLRMM